MFIINKGSINQWCGILKALAANISYCEGVVGHMKPDATDKHYIKPHAVSRTVFRF